MRIAELLAHWRYQKKLNVRQASELIGISASSLSRIERGYSPDGEMLVKLMTWLFTAEEKHEEVPADAGN